MHEMRLSEAARTVGGMLLGDDVAFHRVSTDTRTLQAGDLFLALRGPRFDAHNFVGEAHAKGAVALIVERRVVTPLPQLQVEDAREALGALAAHWRAQFKLPLIAVTGSNGKTTVKEMVAAILGRKAPTLATLANLNNDIGAPLTVLRLTDEHRYAVIELGANRPGEIAYLSRIARPAVAVVTNAAPAHLEGFGDIGGVARAKGEIFSGLEDDGTAVINGDDPRAGLWRVMAGRRACVSFGIRREAEVMALNMRPNDLFGCTFDMCTPAGQQTIVLRLAGRHNVVNALAAAAAALAVGVTLEDVRVGLEGMGPVCGRLQFRRGLRNLRIIDDTYNANPASMRAALEVLVSCAGQGQKVLVMGDMGELGNAARTFHEQVGRQARVIGIDRVYALGELGHVVAGSFGKGGRYFERREDMITALGSELAGGQGDEVIVLVKGSRKMHMDQVVDALLEESEKSPGSAPSSPWAGGAKIRYFTKDASVGG